ncbi:MULTISPECIES: hypothetical protein [unclassified Mesorhizobium]|uniref:hypothetical protein n=1 Tax=unclassified Mesorhizobium TaxID=325217 RepID=UPI000BAEA31D|nr:MULTISPECIES: hypothetical protein [unclassified Mesorhizobium]PBB27167.1 hypothetical protein CK232_09105 [Mesorhizobium sp. WSM4304]PBB76769.1 hypothetical protein CK227_04800 [Mesorhizobium sp. WSM4308]
MLAYLLAATFMFMPDQMVFQAKNDALREAVTVICKAKASTYHCIINHSSLKTWPDRKMCSVISYQMETDFTYDESQQAWTSIRNYDDACQSNETHTIYSSGTDGPNTKWNYSFRHFSKAPSGTNDKDGASCEENRPVQSFEYTPLGGAVFAVDCKLISLP